MISASDLSDEQKEGIRRWADEGAGLGEIQKRVSEEFEITMTYLDARMLIADLGIALREEEKEESATGDAESVLEEGPGKGQQGGVKVTVNEVTPPGMLAVGDVRFSDGETAQWYFDQLGRIGLKPENEDYQPSEEDVTSFQNELQKIAQRQGL